MLPSQCLSLASATNEGTWRLITFYKQTEPLPCSLLQCMSLGRAVPLCGAARLWNVTSLCRKSPERALPAELAGTKLPWCRQLSLNTQVQRPPGCSLPPGQG